MAPPLPAVESTFDSGLEGWTTDNTGPLTHQAAGGNDGGFLQLDNDEGGLAHLFAPAAFLGNLTALDGTTFSFDGRLVAGGGSFYQGVDDYGLVRVTGGGLSASLDLVPGGQTASLGCWQAFSTPFTAAAFGVTQEQWTTILADVTEIRVTVEALFGAEIEGVDNVCLGSCADGTTCSTTTTSSSTSTSSSVMVSTSTTMSTVPSTSSSTSSTSTTTVVSTSTTSVPSTSTTSSTLPGTCELVAGKKLLLKAKAGASKRGIGLLAVDAGITLGAGNGSGDDPVVTGGSVRVMSTGGDAFDDTYELPAGRWSYVKQEGANRGYKFRPTKPIKSVSIQPGKRIKLVANGTGLGHTLGANPEPVDVVLRIGGHCYCLRFGGEVGFKPDKKWLAKNAPAPGGCPAAGSPIGAFVDAR